MKYSIRFTKMIYLQHLYYIRAKLHSYEKESSFRRECLLLFAEEYMIQPASACGGSQTVTIPM